MIKHIVAWHLKEQAHGNDKATNARLIKERLEGLRGRIEGLLTIEVGIDISRGATSADLVLYSEFSDEAALDAYQKHPEHTAHSSFVMEARIDRCTIDYKV